MRKISQAPSPDNVDILNKLAFGKTGPKKTRKALASRINCLFDAYKRYEREYPKPTYLSERAMDLASVAALLGEKYDNAKSNKWLGFIKDRRYNHNCVCCPYCGGPGQYTVDHYLPRDVGFGHLAIFSDNLVPSCNFCQSAKHTFVPTDPKSRCIHPYFDDINDLVAVVVVPKLDPLNIFTATFNYQVVRLVEDQRATDAQELTKAHIRIVKLEERVDVRRHFETKWEHIVRGATHARREKGILAYRYIESLIEDFEEECRAEDDPTLLDIARNMTLYQGIWGSPVCLQEIDHYSAQVCTKPRKPPRRQRRQVPLKIEAGPGSVGVGAV